MSLRVDTNTPAFGFIVTTPGNGSIVLDMFPDALGARWRPDGHDRACKRASDPRSSGACTDFICHTSPKGFGAGGSFRPPDPSHTADGAELLFR